MPQFQDWVSIFLGIIVEATPFLLLGVAVSAVVHVFVSEDALLRFVPRNPLLSLVPALAVGMMMPVCECGNVAVARRFLAKGLPISSCITFLLAAPILNPVALFATYTAFRQLAPNMVWLRGGLAFLVAATVGLLVAQLGGGEEMLAAGIRTQRHDHDHGDHMHGVHDHDHHPASRLALGDQIHAHDHHQHGTTLAGKLTSVASEAGSEFMNMAQVLMLGAGLAAATQVFIPRSDITGLGSGIVLAVLAMMSLAFVLSICSTVDAFFALSYGAIFPTPALLAFLVFGPMLGMKTMGLMLTAFRPRVVLAIGAVTAELVFLAALLWNLKGVVL